MNYNIDFLVYCQQKKKINQRDHISDTESEDILNLDHMIIDHIRIILHNNKKPAMYENESYL